jgi:hypothetical protein
VIKVDTDGVPGITLMIKTIIDLNPIYGGSFNMSYKGFDFNLMFQEHRAMIFAAYHQPSRPIT